MIKYRNAIRCNVIKLRRTAIMTPEEVLDRMCHFVIEKDTVAFMDEVQLFWRMQWDLETVQDPKEKDALRYALKACFLERMAEVWSQAPKNKSMQAPAWCAQVPAVLDSYSVLPDDYQDSFADCPVSEIFAKRNIFAPENYMFFV